MSSAATVCAFMGLLGCPGCFSCSSPWVESDLQAIVIPGDAVVVGGPFDGERVNRVIIVSSDFDAASADGCLTFRDLRDPSVQFGGERAFVLSEGGYGSNTFESDDARCRRPTLETSQGGGDVIVDADNLPEPLTFALACPPGMFPSCDDGCVAFDEVPGVSDFQNSNCIDSDSDE